MNNGLTTSSLFFWKVPKIWVGRTTLNGEKKRMAIVEACMGNNMTTKVSIETKHTLNNVLKYKLCKTVSSVTIFLSLHIHLPAAFSKINNTIKVTKIK